MLQWVVIGFRLVEDVTAVGMSVRVGRVRPNFSIEGDDRAVDEREKTKENTL